MNAYKHGLRGQEIKRFRVLLKEQKALLDELQKQGQ